MWGVLHCCAEVGATHAQVACILLPLCFAYDVFWVLLEPRIMGGPSVMVEVLLFLNCCVEDSFRHSSQARPAISGRPGHALMHCCVPS
jgi:hypothetical protein